MSRYYRSKTGGTVHRAACKYKRGGVPWMFAEPLTHDRVLEVVEDYPWLKACRFCMYAAEVMADYDETGLLRGRMP